MIINNIRFTAIPIIQHSGLFQCKTYDVLACKNIGDGTLEIVIKDTDGKTVISRPPYFDLYLDDAKVSIQTFYEAINQSVTYKEMVNHPSHYNRGKIEVIDAIED